MALSSLELPTTIAQGARAQERQYKYHTSLPTSRAPLSQAHQVSKKVDKYLLRKILPGPDQVQADG